MTNLAKLMERVGPSADGCWPWIGHVRADGYGTFTTRVDGQITPLYAHRLMLIAMGTTIPDGMQVDHLCRVRHCVNPEHLDVVAPRVNYLRGVGTPAVNARKTECKHGHPFDAENTCYRASGGRACRECGRIKLRRRRAQRRTENVA